MIVFLAGFATVVAVVACDALRLVRPDAPLPKVAVYTAAALLSLICVSLVTRLIQVL
ncbi:hypothetical protein QFZ23_004482 [Arthrobacter globiformis]|nr:hypothetical protein [Arthrobacter globiformis]